MSIKFLPFLYDLELIMPTDIHLYEKWLLDADFLEIGPQVYAILQHQGRLEETPLFFREKLKAEFKEIFYQNLFIKQQTREILHQFEELEITVIPLKGVIFAEKYFGHVGARSTSDIDVLIKKKDLQRAIACVQELGFQVVGEEIEEHFHSSCSKVLPNSEIPLTVELHWDILPNNTSTLDIQELWNDSQVVESYIHVRELSLYHTFYMICLHSWRHNLDSLKHYLDIIQLIYRYGEEVDYERLVEDATSHKTLKRMIRTLSVVYQECPFLEKIKSFPFKKDSTFLSYDEKKGRLGRSLRKYADFIDYQFLNFDTVNHSIHAVVKWVKSIL
ncbi:nucleotidyltransferase family protein [Bacillus sp. V3B]|uniref:nucleotidyltransferase family protein n=1 Tax=Bacillus sp. V3B TaxID=2804915 RepID=UPI00210AE60F|nr:nucleotidyltransferase family protein [Bacillus sp. V3B]MCQ6277205.1 nucleotidyltransferase family protein [Bacillus sp. V3B]